MYAYTSQSLSQVLFLTVTLSINIGFGMYLFPSLFLALDRVLVVLFSLKFRKYFGKLRIFKASLVAIKFALSIIDSVNEVVFGVYSVSYFGLKLFNLFIMIFVLLTISVLYTVMAAQIFSSKKQMASSRRSGSNMG